MAIYLDDRKKFRQLTGQAHQVAMNMLRPISRKYDLAEHEYPKELDMLAAMIDGLSESGASEGAGAAGVRRSEGDDDGAVKNGTNLASVMSIAEMCWGDVGLLLSMPRQGLGNSAIASVANEEQHERFDGLWASMAITEPNTGSDSASISTTARLDGDHYVINGEKTSITFADRADAYLIFARTGKPEDGAKGVSAFFIPYEGTKGISRTRFDDVGSAIIGRGSVFFDDVRVPVSHRLGDEGKGFTQVMQGFDYSRALIGLQCCGAAQASLDEAWAYSKEREAFGRPIGQFQGVSFPLAEGESQIAAVRQLCYHTLALRDAGLPHTAEAAMCKWMGPRHAFDVIHQCLLTFGHYGWSKDLPHQQRMRDVMGLEIGDGTAGVMKLIIARERIGRVAVQY